MRLQTPPSSLRMQGGGFTLEVQHLGKDLYGGAEVKALSRGVVVSGYELAETTVWEDCQIGFAGKEAAHSADGILDAAFLPGRVGIAEEGLNREIMQHQMACELGAVVEGDSLAQCVGQGGEETDEMACDAARRLAGQTNGKQDARGAFMHRQDGLAIF